MTNDNNERINGVAYAVLLALEEAGIETYHGEAWGLPVKAVIGPTLITLGVSLVSPNETQKAIKQSHAMQTYVARELDLGFGEKMPLRIYHQGAHLIIEAPRQDPWRPTLLEINDRLQNEIFLGLDTHQVPFYVDLFHRENPGLFVVGRSGSGKTNAMRLIAAQGAAKGWSLALIDLKGGADWRHDLERYADIGVAYDETDATLLLEKVAKISTDRNTGKAATDQPILLVFDEIHKASKKSQAQHVFADLCSTCRSANIRILAGSQRAGKEIEARITANLDTRLVGKVQNNGESFNASGVTGAGAESLYGLGDMLLAVDGVVSGRLQVPRAWPEDVAHLLVPEAPEAPEAPEKPEESKAPEAPEKPEEPKAPKAPEKPEELKAPERPEEPKEPVDWRSRDLKQVVKSIEELAKRERVELLKSKPRAKFPPVSLIVQAAFWTIRRGELPSHKRLNEWRKAASKKNVGLNQRRIVIQIASEVLGIGDAQ